MALCFLLYLFKKCFQIMGNAISRLCAVPGFYLYLCIRCVFYRKHVYVYAHELHNHRWTLRFIKLRCIVHDCTKVNLEDKSENVLTEPWPIVVISTEHSRPLEDIRDVTKKFDENLLSRIIYIFLSRKPRNLDVRGEPRLSKFHEILNYWIYDKTTTDFSVGKWFWNNIKMKIALVLSLYTYKHRESNGGCVEKV